MARHERDVKLKRITRRFTYFVLILIMLIIILLLFFFRRLENSKNQKTKPTTAYNSNSGMSITNANSRIS